jgi:DNA-binding NarL/FixJ family response regulator
MGTVEISLIVMGVIFMIASFFIEERLSQNDIEKINALSEKQMKIVIEKQMKNADVTIDEKITEQLDYNLEIAERAMEKETNSKVMTISEYSDTVLDSMNKTHNEIMFLYSMLNDKHEELTKLAGELSEFSANMKSTQDEVLARLAQTAEDVEEKLNDTDKIEEDELLSESIKNGKTNTDSDDKANHNVDILRLHKSGKNNVEIAKELGLGLGEVKFVIGLYRNNVKEAIQ